MLEGRLQQAYQCGVYRDISTGCREWWWEIHSWISGYAKLTSIRIQIPNWYVSTSKANSRLTFGQGLIRTKIKSLQNSLPRGVTKSAYSKERLRGDDANTASHKVITPTISFYSVPFTQCNTSDVLLEWRFYSWCISPWNLSWISWLVRGPVYTLGILLTSGGVQFLQWLLRCIWSASIQDKVVRKADSVRFVVRSDSENNSGQANVEVGNEVYLCRKMHK